MAFNPLSRLPLSGITTAATALANLILVSPQTTIGYQPEPKADGSQAIAPSILFHYEGEQTATLESDITDHYVEDNTAVQDQIALRPEIITTHGFVGELNDITPPALNSLKLLADKLTIINAYTPVLSETAILAYNEAAFFYSNAKNVVDSAVASWTSINQKGGESVINGNSITIEQNQTKQQIYFQQFYGYWRTRTLFTVQTPWAIFQNMAIKSLRAIQDADTRMITDFEVSFKLIRFASTITAATSQIPLVQGRLANQSSFLVNLGVSTPPFSLTNFSTAVGGLLP